MENNIINSSNNLDIAVDLSDSLSLSSWEMEDVQTARKVKEIIDFLNEEKDPYFYLSIMKRTSMKSTMKPVDHFYTYVELQKKTKQLQRQLESVNQELKYYE